MNTLTILKKLSMGLIFLSSYGFSDTPPVCPSSVSTPIAFIAKDGNFWYGEAHLTDPWDYSYVEIHDADLKTQQAAFVRATEIQKTARNPVETKVFPYSGQKYYYLCQYTIDPKYAAFGDIVQIYSENYGAAGKQVPVKHAFPVVR